MDNRNNAKGGNSNIFKSLVVILLIAIVGILAYTAFGGNDEDPGGDPAVLDRETICKIWGC